MASELAVRSVYLALGRSRIPFLFSMKLLVFLSRSSSSFKCVLNVPSDVAPLIMVWYLSAAAK